MGARISSPPARRLKTTFDEERMAVTQDMIATTVWFDCAAEKTLSLNQNEMAQAMFLVLDFQLDCLVAVNQKQLEQYKKRVERLTICSAKNCQFAKDMLSSGIGRQFAPAEFWDRIIRTLDHPRLDEALRTYTGFISSLQFFLGAYEREWRHAVQGDYQDERSRWNKLPAQSIRGRLEELATRQGKATKNPVCAIIQFHLNQMSEGFDRLSMDLSQFSGTAEKVEALLLASSR